MGSINHYSSCCLQQLQQAKARQAEPGQGGHTHVPHLHCHCPPASQDSTTERGQTGQQQARLHLSTAWYSSIPDGKEEAQGNKGTKERTQGHRGISGKARTRQNDPLPGTPAQALSSTRTVLTQLFTFGSFPQASQLLLIGDSAALRQIPAFHQNSSPGVSLGETH